MYTNIQFLRGIAAVLVFFLHFSAHYQAMNGDIQLFKSIAIWGFTGVDIFFVISGFVIAMTTHTKDKNCENLLQFIKYRLARIYLGYWPFLLFALLLIYLDQAKSIAGLNLFSSVFLSSVDISKLVLPVSWTLSYELLFYGLVTTVFFIRFRYFVCLLLVLSVLILIYPLLQTTPNPLLDFIFSPFLLEFFFGVVLYSLHHRFNSASYAASGLAFAVLFFWLGINFDAKIGLARTFTFGFAAAALLLAAISLEKTKLLQSNKFFVAVGNASYTLYLCHVLWIYIFYLSGLRSLLSIQPQWIIEVSSLFFILFVLLFSHLFYQYIEAPLYRSAKKINFQSKQNSQNI